MKRRRATQVEQTSRCPHGPYATHSKVSAQTAQLSSMAGTEPNENLIIAGVEGEDDGKGEREI